ncbi:MAG: prolyl oligopeptidase family serine peptidase [Bacteroidota bacterium]
MNTDKRFYFIIITSVIVVILFVSLFVFFPAFTTKQESNNLADSIKPDTNKAIKRNGPVNDTLLIIDNRKVFIKVPVKKSKGTFLVLHGWNFPADDWCNKTSLCNKVTEHGFYVVLPDMGKSVYQDQDYPETRSEWLVYPTRSWLSDTLIPLLRKNYSLLLENDSNYIVGLSTGARGVALVLLDYPDLFKGAAALSGDYDQVQMPDDNLMTAYYGAYYTHNERWHTTDNPVNRIKEFKTPIYLGHGTIDKVVPPAQTIEFYDSLKKYHPALKIKLSKPEAAHTYDYWDSEVDSIMIFFGIK